MERRDKPGNETLDAASMSQGLTGEAGITSRYEAMNNNQTI
jgi:hypothetical protein